MSNTISFGHISLVILFLPIMTIVQTPSQNMSNNDSMTSTAFGQEDRGCYVNGINQMCYEDALALYTEDYNECVKAWAALGTSCPLEPNPFIPCSSPCPPYGDEGCNFTRAQDGTVCDEPLSGPEKPQEETEQKIYDYLPA